MAVPQQQTDLEAVMSLGIFDDVMLLDNSEAESEFDDREFEKSDSELELENLEASEERGIDSSRLYFRHARHKVLSRKEEREYFLKYSIARKKLKDVESREKKLREKLEISMPPEKSSKLKKQLARLGRSRVNFETEFVEIQNLIVLYNLRLVISVAKHYESRSFLGILDLIQEGNLGLMDAVSRFKLTHETKFSTYATWWIKQKIRRAIYHDSKTIRFPVHVYESLARLIRAGSELTKSYKRVPSIDELAQATHLNSKKVLFLLTVYRTQNCISLDQTIRTENDGGGEPTIGDTLPQSVIPSPSFSLDWDAARDEVLAECARVRLFLKRKKRSERDIEIAFRCFGLNGSDQQETLEGIGVEFCVTKQRVRQIKEKIRRVAMKSGTDIEVLGQRLRNFREMDKP